MKANIILPAGHRNNSPNRIVLHAMGQYILANQAVLDYYAKQGIRLELGRTYHAPEWLRVIGVSAHKLGDPSGLVIQCRYSSTGAYHASGFNKDSLGYEFLVPGIHTYGSLLEALRTPYLTSEAFDSGVEEIRGWMNKYNIEKDRIDEHSKLSPDRKKDPGEGFPLTDFLNAL